MVECEEVRNEIEESQKIYCNTGIKYENVALKSFEEKLTWILGNQG